MNVSVFDLFKIGIGPSSSHTVGPMIAACRFASHIEDANLLAFVRARPGRPVRLARRHRQGPRHRQGRAARPRRQPARPRSIPTTIEPRLKAIRATKQLELLGKHVVRFDEREHLGFFRKLMPGAPGSSIVHPNGMRFQAFDENGQLLVEKEYYSVGGGFVINREGDRVNGVRAAAEAPHPFRTGDDLMRVCRETRSVDRADHDEERMRVAHGTGSARRHARDLAHDVRVRRARLQDARRVARPDAREAPRGRSVRATAFAFGRVAARSAVDARLGQSLRDGRQRGKRGGRARRHGADQRRCRRDSGGAALLREVHAQRERRRHRHVPADGGGDRHHLQGERHRSRAPKSAARARSASRARWPPPRSPP